MARYRKLPVEIEAIQYTGSFSNINEIWDMFGAGNVYGPTDQNASTFIDTLEGRMECKPGDYLIKGVQGELYPCKPDIFAKTYEEVI